MYAPISSFIYLFISIVMACYDKTDATKRANWYNTQPVCGWCCWATVVTYDMVANQLTFKSLPSFSICPWHSCFNNVIKHSRRIQMQWEGRCSLWNKWLRQTPVLYKELRGDCVCGGKSSVISQCSKQISSAGSLWVQRVTVLRKD
jgi:hypothetical protein